MAGGSGRIVTGAGLQGKPRVENERLWVDCGGTGGGGGSGNVTIIAPLPLPVDIVSSISLPVNDNGGSITVDGTVVVSSITAPVTLVEPVSIDDNGGSITVDGTVAISGTVTVDGTVVVSSITAPVTLVEPVSVDDNGGSLTVDGTVAVSSVGGTVTVGGTVAVSSVIPGVGATNLGKAEDDPHVSGDVGVMALAVRRDVSIGAAADGDYHTFQTSSTGRLWITGNITGIDTTVTITGAVSVSPVSPGVAAANLGKAEDQLAVSGDVGVMALAVRADTPAATATNGDYVPLLTDAFGRLHIGPGTLASSLGKAEDAPHGSGDVGVMSLAVRQDTLAALAADGDYIPFTVDSLGRLNVSAYVVAEPFTVKPFSSSTNGRPIAVNGGGFVAVHTTTNVEVITMFVTNVGALDRTLILGIGGTATGDQVFIFAPAGETVVAMSEVQIGTVATPVAIQANLDVAGTCRVFGRVTRRAA